MNNNPLTLAALSIGAFVCTLSFLAIRRENTKKQKETDDFIKKSREDTESAIKDFEEQTGIKVPGV